MEIDFYCIHHAPSTDRKLYMEELFYENHIEPIWITDFLPGCDSVMNHETVYSSHSANQKYLNSAEISLYLKQKQALELIKKTNRIGVICEDDLEKPNFSLRNFCIDVAPNFTREGGDILFIGDTDNQSISHKYKDIPIVSESWMKSRCAHCYMITPEAVNKIFDYVEKPEAPFDWQINYAIDQFNLKIYWAVKGVKQRTSQNAIKSLLR